MKEIVFVADIAGDIDDIIAIDFLNREGRLDYVVLDGKSRDENREKEISKMGIRIEQRILPKTTFVFCGGGMTKIADYLEHNKLDLLCINGFFAGCNIVPQESILEKFKGRTTCRSYNPGLDSKSAWKVINSDNLNKMLIVSKNVCHHEENIRGGWHKDSFLNNYKLRESKRLHDLLMVKEGLKYIDFEPDMRECYYEYVRLFSDNENGIEKWGCERYPALTYDRIEISLYYKKI